MLADLFTIAASGAFALFFFVTMWSYFQRRVGPRLDAALLFGVLTLTVLSLAVDTAALNHVFALMVVGPTFLQPFLLLRMARHFRQVPALWLWGTLVVAVATISALAMYGVRSMPTWASGLVMGNFLAGNSIAVWAFVREARRGATASHQRMAIAAVATAALLGVMLIQAMLSFVDAPLLADARVIALMAMAVAYPLAFAAPRGVRRLWHLGTVNAFSEELHDNFAQMTAAEVRRRLHEGAAAALGCTTFLLDRTHPVEGPVARALERKLEAFGKDSLTLPAERVPEEFRGQADGTLRGMHIVKVDQHPLVVVVLQDRASLFPEEDLELVRLLCIQAGLALAQVEVLDARQQEFERTKELESFKSMFLRSVGHELANPLSPVRLQLRALRRQELTEKGSHSLDIIDRNVERLRRLITDMSTVAKLQDAKLDMAMDPIDVAALVKESCAVQEAPAKEGGCSIVLDTNGALPVRGDKQRIGQVLDNLLSNAIKYSPGGGTIRVTVRPRNGMAFVEVQDQGLGLTEEQLGKMFGLYERFHKGSNPKIPGTGLGLAIVKGIIEGHGGTIGVTSDGPGTGTCFRIEVPLGA